MNIFYVNGEYLPESAAQLNVRDLAILRGYGVFDYLRTYGGQPFRLDKNIERLCRSCELIELALPCSPAEIEAIVLETLRRNIGSAAEFSIRLVVTGGVSSNNINPDGASSLIVIVQPVNDYPAENFTQGVKVITVENQRLVPAAKTIMYTPAILAQKKAKAAGAIEALYHDANGNILEATTSNFFVFFGNTLVTPPIENEEILAGVTRMTVLELAREHFQVEIRPLAYAELQRADEAFLSSANKQVMPVVQVDDLMIGTGQPGEGTQQLMALFQALIDKRKAGIEI